jgi:hypothetical protein
MLLVLFTLEDFIRVRKLSRARESSPPRTARGRHNAGAVRHSAGGKVAVSPNSAKMLQSGHGSMATVPRNPLHCHHFVSLLANDPASPLCTEIDESIGAGAGERPLDLRLKWDDSRRSERAG